MNKEFKGLIRHALTTLGGVGATHGYIAGSDVEALVAAAMILIGLGWSFYEKYAEKQV